MTRRIILDVSSNNGNVNFTAMKRMHPELVGVIVKATEGNSYVNPLFTSQINAARAAGLLVGAYSFMHPSAAGTGDTAKFLSVIAGQDLKLGVWLDCETSDGLDPATVSSRFQEDAVYVRAHYPGKVGIYTGAWFWNPQTKGSGWAAKYPAWIANYSGSGPNIPYPWDASNTVLWQFTDNYFGSGIDASEFRGSDIAWNNLIGFVPTIGDDEVSVLPIINPASDVGHPKALNLAKYLITQVQYNRDVSTPAALAQAVKDFQTFFKVPGGPTGVLNYETWKALLAVSTHQ